MKELTILLISTCWYLLYVVIYVPPLQLILFATSNDYQKLIPKFQEAAKAFRGKVIHYSLILMISTALWAFINWTIMLTFITQTYMWKDLLSCLIVYKLDIQINFFFVFRLRFSKRERDWLKIDTTWTRLRHVQV